MVVAGLTRFVGLCQHLGTLLGTVVLTGLGTVLGTLDHQNQPQILTVLDWLKRGFHGLKSGLSG